jgi:hypothetical protein
VDIVYGIGKLVTPGGRFQVCPDFQVYPVIRTDHLFFLQTAVKAV